MNRFLALSASVALALSLLTGCSIDRVEIIEHPSQAKQGDTIDVLFSTAYSYVTNSSTAILPVVRDSLHVLIGFSDQFEVLSLDYYDPKDLNIKTLLSIEDPEVLEQMIMDSLKVYSERKKPMIKDGGLEAAISGRTVTVHDQEGTETTINTDDIDQWKGFSSDINISIEAGSEMDTAFNIDSILALAENEGFDIDEAELDLFPIKVDSVGIKVIPIFLLAKIITPPNQGNYTLYYYGKTGKMPKASVGTGFTDDGGDMVSGKITITGTSARNPLVNKSGKSIQVYPNPFRERVQILPGFTDNKKLQIEIYSIDGTQVRKIIPGNSRNLFWDGRDQSGAFVSPGSYMIRVNNGESVFSRKVDYIR